MSTTYTSSSLSSTIPALGDVANVVTAFQDYHASIAPLIGVLGRANTFTAANTFSSTVAVSGATTFASSVTHTSSSAPLLFNDGTNVEGRFLASGGVMYIQAGTTSADTSAELRITRYASASNISSFKIYADVTSTYGSLYLAAGTSSLAPLAFTSGTKLTTPVSGAFEYDGNVIYATPKVNNTTAGRGLLPAQNILVLAANNTQSVSSAGATQTTDVYALNKSIYLAASQAYFVDMSIRVYHNMTYNGTGAGSLTFLLKAPTNSSFQIDTQNQLDMATLNTAGTTTFEYLDGLGVSKVIKSGLAASDQGYSVFRWSGVVYTGTTAGNFGPAFTLSATGSGSTYTTQIVVQNGSYCKVTPLGTYASEINIGGWA